MSHLTDGEIHVHLDGALDLLPDHRAAAIRAHLSRCDDCSARMREERRIRERASEILGSAGSAEGHGSTGRTAEAPGPAAGSFGAPLPSFETIRERAAAGAGPDPSTATEEEVEGRSGESASGRSRESWYRGVAWAATVVLSLGVGWYARSGVVETDMGARPVLRSPGGPVAGADRAPGTVTREGGSIPSDDEVAEASAPDRAPDGAVPGAAERAAPQVAEARSPRALADREEAPAAAGIERSLAVTGLPVISVGWEVVAGEEAPTLRVVQRLPSGDPLSLRYTALQPEARAGFRDQGIATLEAADEESDEAADDAADGTADEAPEAEPPAPTTSPPPDAASGQPATGSEARDSPAAEAPSLESRTPVVRRHGPWLLEASAPLEPDSLRALLNRLPSPE